MITNQTAITPIKTRKQSWKVATFDIETFSEEGSQLLAPFNIAMSTIDGIECKTHYSAYSLIHEILAKQNKYRWFAHNGANFDFKYLFTDDVNQLLKQRGYGIFMIGGKIPKAMSLVKGNTRILICDSYKVMPDKLSNLGVKLDTEVTKGFINFENGERFDKLNAEHVEYLRCDVISLYQIVTKYRAIINEQFGSELKCTASSTSFAAWRVNLSGNVWKHPRACDDFIRLAYYGGRTQAFFTGKHKGVYGIDVNSLYPYCMREFGGLSHPFQTDNLEDCGFYRIITDVPESLKFGPLPMRKKDNTGILFPTGKFVTHASSIEIQLAIELGCNIDIISGWAFEQNDTGLFADFVNKCEDLRSRDYNGALGVACKYMQNNLYGFFGMNPEREELYYGEYPQDEGEMWYQVRGDNGETLKYVWAKTTRQDSINCIPAFAAWITANARVYLLRQMLAEEAAGNRVLYCDTDSIFTTGPCHAPIHPNRYGAWKDVSTGREVITILAPKSYRITGGDKDVYKCKGIPNRYLRNEDFDKALEGQDVVKEFVQMNSLYSVIKGSSMGRERAYRTMPKPERMRSMVFNGIDTWNSNICLALEG